MFSKLARSELLSSDLREVEELVTSEREKRSFNIRKNRKWKERGSLLPTLAMAQLRTCETHS